MVATGFQVDELIDNRYRVQQVVGTGGMGTLYRVADEGKDGRVLAFKTVRLKGAGVQETDWEAQFRREFQLLTQLRHPNLVSVHDYGVAGRGELYFTMEWVDGHSLEPAEQILTPQETVEVIVQICRALAYLHARGVVHGDLKPSNVLMDGQTVKIVDFGVALEAGSSEVRSPYYTPGYAAPELREGEGVDYRADLYSLGGLWYALLVGEPPLFMIGADRLIPLMLDEALETQDQLPRGVGRIVARLLATRRDERYNSANQVIEAINELLGLAYTLETQETVGSYALRANFVDRVAELDLLGTLWQQTQTGRRGIVLISGESGVGKTRLVEELEVKAEVEGARVVWGHCVETGGAAYQPWRQVLRLLIRHVEDREEDTGMVQVGPVLATLLPELWQWECLAGAQPPAELEPEAARQRLNAAIVWVLIRAAAQRPVLVVIDDGHWADEATLAMLSYLARLPVLARLLVCVTYRSEEVTPDHVLECIAGDRVEHLRLERLTPEMTADLACSMLGMEALPGWLLDRLQRTTGGNALFVQELIRSLALEGKVLQRTVEGWQVDRAALEAAILPETIRQVVERRLEQLPVDAQETLRQAAVVGSVFWEGAVAAVGHVSQAKTRAILPELVGQDLVAERDESTLEGEREYIFSNPGVQEAIYAGITGEQGRLWHGRAAGWWMARSPEEIEERLGVVADHLERAGEQTQTAVYLYRAGQQAASRFANVEAVAYFSRALELTAEGDLARRYDITLARERVYHLQGAREAQSQDLDRLKDLAGELDEDTLQRAGGSRRIEGALLRARYGEAVSDYPMAIEAAREAVDLSHAIGDVSSEAAGHLEWGAALWRYGDIEAAYEHLDQALALARSAGVRQIEARSLFYLGNTLNDQGEGIEAGKHFEQALLAFREIGDRRHESRGLNSLGNLALLLGDFAQARRWFEETLRVAHEIGYRRGEGIARCNLALLSHQVGDDEACREYSRQTLDIAREIGGRSFQAYALVNLGHGLLGLDRPAEATQAYETALDIRRSLGQHSLAMEPLAGLARVALAQDDVHLALAYAERILDYLEGGSVGGVEEPLRVYLTCYHVLKANSDPRAVEILERAYRLLHDRAAKIEDEEQRSSYLTRVPVHQEIVSESASERIGE